ncbi:MAG: PDZ domain-containing protein [Pirellulales bacterium]
MSRHCGLFGHLVLICATTAAGCLATSPAHAQAPPPAASAISQLQDQAETIRRYKPDAEEAKRAKRFLELTSLRAWGYRDDKGMPRTFEGAYDSEADRNGEPCLTFVSKQYVPVRLLDARSAAELAEVAALKEQLADDYAALQDGIKKRQAEMEAQCAAGGRAIVGVQPQVRQARMLADTNITVVDGLGAARILQLAAGEMFEIVGETPKEWLLLVGGQATPVDRRFCEEMRPVIAVRPGMPGIVGPANGPLVDPIAPGAVVVPGMAIAPVDPPKLDCRIGSYQFPDGRAALLIESVAVGGLADRHKLQAGDVIESVNDLPVGTLDDYRIASTRAGGALKLLVFRPALNKNFVVPVAAPNVPMGLGVFGKPDFRGEFVIDDVLDGSIADQLGLQRDDKLLRVNDVEVESQQQLRELEAASGGKFRIRALINGQPTSLAFP